MKNLLHFLMAGSLSFSILFISFNANSQEVPIVKLCGSVVEHSNSVGVHAISVCVTTANSTTGVAPATEKCKKIIEKDNGKTMGGEGFGCPECPEGTKGCEMDITKISSESGTAYQAIYDSLNSSGQRCYTCPAGTYTIKYKCKSCREKDGQDHSYKATDPQSGMDEINFNKNLLQAKLSGLYPNPAYNQVTVAFESITELNKAYLQVTDITGKVITEHSMGDLDSGNHSFSLNTWNFPAGIYHVHLFNKQQKLDSQPLMIVR